MYFWEIVIGIILVIIIGCFVFQKIAERMAFGSKKEQEERRKKREEYEKRLRHYQYYVHGLNHKNEEGKKTITVILSAARKLNDFYRETRKADFEDDPYMQVEEFEGVALEAELVPTEFEGKPAVKVYIRDEEERHHAGWIPAEKAEDVTDMIQKHRCITWMEVEGGKVKFLGVDEDGRESVEIDDGEEPFPVVKIEYESAE